MKRENRVKILRIASGYGEMIKSEIKDLTKEQEERAKRQEKKREEKNIRSFAHFYGVSVENLLAWEMQEKVPSYAFSKKLCKQREVPIEYLYGYDYIKGHNIEDVEDESILEDYNKASEDYKKYIEFKECDCKIVGSFLLSENLAAIQSIDDIDSAAADGTIDKKDPRLIEYLRSQFNIENYD